MKKGLTEKNAREKNKRGFKKSTGDEGKTIVIEGEHSETGEAWESEKGGGKIRLQRIEETCLALRAHKQGMSQSYLKLLYPCLCYNMLMITHKQSE